MSILYIYNTGRNIHIKIDGIHVQYLGPYSLNRFVRINKFQSGVIYVATEFNDSDGMCIEEDYIDLNDIFGEYKYNTEEIISKIKHIKIGDGPKMRKASKTNKMKLIDSAVMVSDNLAIIPQNGTAGDIHILVVSMAKPENKALIRLNDYAIVSSNMSNSLLKRAKDTVKRNQELIIEELRELKSHA